MENLLKTVSFTDKEIRRARFDYRSLQHFKDHLRPTVFIGLGGGGCKAVGYLKELFDSTFGGKDEPGAFRIPENLKFLGFDSDTEKPGNLVIEQEWFQLLSEGLGGGVWEKLREEPHYRDWVSQKMPALDLGAGCKGYRGLGRFLFHQNVGRFVERTQKAYDAATSAKVEGAVRAPVFYIFCTLAGGTGSGCLLDACFALRANFPAAEIRGFLALAEGFGDSPKLIRRAKVGVHAALRELDHFMSAERLKDWIENERGGKADFNFPNGRGGRYMKPLNLAFLFAPVTAAERNTLRDSSAVSQFMARCAFALSAWPSDDGGKGGAGMTFESHLSNFDTELIEPTQGANCCYLVPGYGSIHTPVEETGDLFALESAQHVLDWLKHGAGNPKHTQEAESFLADLNLTTERLLGISRELVNLDGALPKESSQEKVEDLKGILEKRARRYDQAENEALFRTFNVMLESRFKEEVLRRVLDYAPDAETRRESRLAENTGTMNPALLSLRDTMGRFCETFEAQVNGMMVDPRYRRLGVEDFVGDLLLLLKGMRRTLSGPVQGAEQTLRDMLDQHWKKGHDFRVTLDDVCENAGLLDFDWQQIGDLTADYEAHFHAGWSQVATWVTHAAALFLINSAIRYAEQRRIQIEEVFNHFDAAAARIDEKISDLVRDLKLQADGMGDDLETINSASLYDLRWRERYVSRNKLDEPEGMVRRAKDAARHSAKPATEQGEDALLGAFEVALEKESYFAQRRVDQPDEPDWNPLAVSVAHGDSRENKNQQPLDLFICQDLANAMMRVLDPGLQTLAQWEGGIGLRTAFDYASEDGLRSPETLKDILQQSLRQCQPQANISMMGSRLNRETSNLLFFAGPQDISDDLLRGHVQARFINRALTFESHRMGLVSYTYPISLAGMPRVQGVFKQTYDAYFEQYQENPDRLEEELRKLHCFPRSWQWRDPWEVDEAADPAHETMAKALLVSWALEQPDMLAEEPRAILQSAIDGMHRVTAAPKTKALGAFLIAGSEVWAAPFCELDLARNTIGDSGSPIRVGGTLSAAMSSVIRSEFAEARQHLERWVEWFLANKSALYSDDQLKQLRKMLIEKARDKVTTADKSEQGRWKLVCQHAQGPFIYRV